MNIGTLWAHLGLDNSELNRGAADSRRTINELSNDIGDRLPRASSLASRALAGLSTAFTAYSIVNEVKAGISAIDDLRLSTIQIASQIATLQGPNNVAEHYKEAKVYAAALAETMEKIDVISFANNEGLMAMSQTMINQGIILDTNNKKETETFAAISNAIAMQTRGQNQAIQARQEMRGLLSGDVTMNTLVAKQIDEQAKRSGEYKNGLKAIVELSKQHGDFWQRIEPYLTGVKAASGDIQNTWESVTSSFSTSLTMLRRETFAGVYDDAIKSGVKFVTWIKENTSTIASAIKTMGSIIGTAAEIAAAYFALFVVAPAIINLATVAVQRFNIQMALSSMEMAGASTAARVYALVMGTQVVSAAWAASTALGKLAIVGQVVFAFFVGWKIGEWISKHCAVARQAAAALVAGLHQIWIAVKAGGKMIAAAIGAADDAMHGNFSSAANRLQNVVDEYKKESAFWAEVGHESFVEAGMEPKQAAVVEAKVNKPVIPKISTSSAKQDLSDLAERQAAYDRQIRESELAVQDELTKESLALTQDKLRTELELIRQKNEMGLMSDREYLQKKYQMERKADEQELADLNVKAHRAYLAYAATSDSPDTDLKQQNEDYVKYLQTLEAARKKTREMDSKSTLFSGEFAAAGQKSVQVLEDLKTQILEIQGRFEEAAVARADFEKISPDYMKSNQAIKENKDQLMLWNIEEGKRKDRANASAAALAKIEESLSAISIAENNYNISVDKAANKRLELYQEEKRLLLERATAEKGSTETSRQLQEQLRQSITQVNAKISDQTKILNDRTALGGMVSAINDYKNQIDDIGSQVKSVFSDAFKNVEDSLTSMITTGKINFSKFVDSLIEDINRFIIRQAVMKPLLDNSDAITDYLGSIGSKLGSSIGSLFGGGTSAKGSVWENGVRKFASGGIVDKPIMFGSANGIGIAGEAGTEAIMPVAKMSNGQLGINATSNNTSKELNVKVEIINQTGQTFETEQGKTRFDLDEMITTVILKKAKASPDYRLNLRSALGMGN